MKLGVTDGRRCRFEIARMEMVWGSIGLNEAYRCRISKLVGPKSP